MTIWIVVIPGDYATADAMAFRTKQEAIDYKLERGDTDRDGSHYIAINEQQL
jgi:hypothetical protein